MKKIKFIKSEKIEEGFIVDDKLFLGGKKVIHILEDGTTGYTSIKLVKIIN